MTKFLDSWLGRTVAILTVLGAIYGCIRYVVKAELADLSSEVKTANSGIAQVKDSIARIDNDVKKTNERIDKALTDALDKLVALKKTGSNGNELLTKGQTILAIARSVEAKLAPATLRNYGLVVSELTKSPVLSRPAWNNLAEAASYRTFLNSEYAPRPSDFTASTGTEDYRFNLNLIPDRPHDPREAAVVVGTAGGHLPEEQSARLEHMADANPHGSGFGFIVVEGGSEAILLDGMYLKRVIVRNARIIYHGFPVRLEDVYFVNCKFIFPSIEGLQRDRQTPVRQLTHAILEATAVNVSTASPT